MRTGTSAAIHRFTLAAIGGILCGLLSVATAAAQPASPDAREANDRRVLEEAQMLNNPDGMARLYEQCQTAAGADSIFVLWDHALWRQARKTNTPESYGDYLLRFPDGIHKKDANLAHDEAMWAFCLQNGSPESYELYLQEHRRGKHATDAQKALKELEYERAKSVNTIEAYEAFLKNHSGHDSAKARLKRLKYQEAVNKNDLETWRRFVKKNGSLWSARRSGDSDQVEMVTRARTEYERLLFDAIVAAPTVDLCKEYLKEFDEHRHVAQVKLRMEPVLYAHAVEANSIEAYKDYLKQYEDHPNAADISGRLDPLVYADARKLDWHTGYKDYIKRFPAGRSIVAAQARLDSLQSATGAYVVDFPDTVVGRSSPYSNVSSPFFGWDTHIKDTTGKVRFKARASGVIVDPRGGRWDPSRSIDTTNAGATGTDDYWCSSPNHELCGGYAKFTWIIEDAGGHTTEVKEVVVLKHNNCPGPKKKKKK